MGVFPLSRRVGGERKRSEGHNHLFKQSLGTGAGSLSAGDDPEDECPHPLR